MLAVAACGRGPAPGEVSDPAYRAELLSRVVTDQAVRDTLTAQLRASGTPTFELFQSMMAVDSANLAWLKPRLLAAGIPTPKQVGRDGVKAALLLLQHADSDPGFQAAMLPAVEAAFHAGGVTGQEFALLSDRVASAEGRPQRFGTQTTIQDGVIHFKPIADSAGVDARRAAFGLMPLAQYRTVLDSVYGKQPAIPPPGGTTP